MKAKIKDGTKLNLYVDKGIVAILDRLAAERGTSRSQLVEQLARAADRPTAPKPLRRMTPEERKEEQNRAQVNKLPNSSAFLELSAQAEKDAISGLAALVNAQKPPLSPAPKPKFPGRSRAADKKGL